MKAFLRIFVTFFVIMTPYLSLAKTSAANAVVSLYGAQSGKVGDPQCRNHEGECLILQGTPVILNDYSFDVSPKGRPEVAIKVNKDAAQALG